MKKIYLFLFSCLYFNTVFTAQEIPAVTKTYEQYQQNAKNICDWQDAPWSKSNALVPIPQYPKLDANSVNSQINSPNIDNLSSDEKIKLMTELNMQRIWTFDWFKTLEVARLQYRATMNSVFACAILESRLKILDDLRENFTKISSEINKQLDNEKVRLSNKKDSMNCNSNTWENIGLMTELINTSTRQYCHYRHYLSYLDENLQNDKTSIEKLEKSIWTGDDTKVSSNNEDWIKKYNKYTTSLANEINRAETTLPRAIKAYRDMERAYPVHLMLLIIYDDFIRLRKNLSNYMNASTQLYLKAFNAQDANKR